MVKTEKVLAIVVLLGITSGGNAFKIENYNRGAQGQYTAYCFNKGEADQIKGAIGAGAGMLSAISCVPGAGSVASVIASALGGINAVLWWNTHNGTGFAVHVPTPGGTGIGRVPFLWDWDEGKAVY